MQHAPHAQAHDSHASGHYGRLLSMVLLSFVAMYILMYAMVNTFGNVYSNLNQFYMAGLMAAPMLPIELMLMGRMYPNRKLNVALALLGVVVMIVFWVGVRQQVGITDQQFLRSMIPHHAGAVLMCKENKLRDPELQQLCRQILGSQQAEIDLMRSKLQRLP